MIKIPNWPEANQLAIYKHSQGFELRTTREQIQLAVRMGLKPFNLRASELCTYQCKAGGGGGGSRA